MSFFFFKLWSNASGGLQSSLFIQWSWPFCLLVLVPCSCFSRRSKCKTLFVLTYGGFASPCDFDLHLFCSGSLHSLWTWRPSTPRSILTTSSFMSGILFLLCTPKFIVASQESPFFFLFSSPPHRSLLWSLTSYLSASPAAKALMRFLFRGRSNEGHARFCWPAACQVRIGALSCRKTDFFFCMSLCKVVSWKFSNVPNALSSF